MLTACAWAVLMLAVPIWEKEGGSRRMAEAELRRRFRVIFAATGIGVVLILCTMLGWRGGFISEEVSSFLFLGAAVLVGTGAMYVALHIPLIPWISKSFFFGAVLLILSQTINATDGIAAVQWMPLIGRSGAFYFPYVDDLLLYAGVGVICASCYFAVLDAALARTRLSGESEQRKHALHSAEQYAAALTLSERNAREQLAELENLYDTAPVGLCVVDPELRFAKVNRRMAEMDGALVNNHLGRAVDAVIPHVGRSVAHLCREVLLTGQARANVELVFAENEHNLPAGHRTIWLMSCFPLFADSGQVKGVQVVAQDISDLKEAQASQRQLELQVQRAQKLESLGVLAGGIAHDFNNLLTGILGNVSLVLEGRLLEPRARTLLLRIEDAAKRAAELTRQMLAYAGQGALEARLINVSALIREATPLLRASVTKRADLEVDCPESLAHIVGDAAQLRQVVMNLVINASESLGEFGGQIAIRSGVRNLKPEDLAGCLLSDEPWPGDYVYIEISDSGCGIDEEELGRIFDPFYSTKFTGRGLGLAVVVGIIRRHRGALQVESHVGEGSVFRIFLPVAGKTEASEIPTPSAGLAVDVDGAVLIIDDEEAVRNAASEMIQDLGFEVFCACDGDEGEELFRAHRERIRAVLLDLTMPGRSGAETYYALKQLNGGVAIIVSSGFAEEHVRSQFEPGERLLFLQKPYTFAALSRFIRTACLANHA